MKKIIQIMTLLVMSQLAIAQERLKGCIVSSAAQEREFKDKPYLKQTMSKSLFAAKVAYNVPLKKENTCLLLPNYTRDFTTILMNSNCIINTIKVFSATGREFKTSNTNLKLNEVKLDLRALPNGVYFIETIYTEQANQNPQSIQKKIIKL